MSTEHATNSRTAYSVAIFGVLTVALGWVGRWVDSVAGAAPGSGPGMLIWIVSPLVVSFLLRAFAGGGWRDLGLAPNERGNGRWYAAAVFVYPAAAMIVIAISRAAGDEPPVTAAFIPAFLALLLPQLVTNIPEEFGFRGYLAPKLTALGISRLPGHVFVGFVWGVWHLAYLAAITRYTNEAMITLAPRFILGAVAASLVYGELRQRTNSVWPAVITQTIGGAFIGALFTVGLAPPAWLGWLRSPVIEGGLMMGLFAAYGLWLCASASRVESERVADETSRC